MHVAGINVVSFTARTFIQKIIAKVGGSRSPPTLPVARPLHECK